MGRSRLVFFDAVGAQTGQFVFSTGPPSGAYRHNETSPGGTGFGVGHSMTKVNLEPGGLNTSADANGDYSFGGVADGTFTLTASGARYLSRQCANIVVSETPVNVNAQELRVGLVSGDSVDNINDVSAAAASFGLADVGRVDGLGRVVDTNGDGVVNINDISAISSNFGLTSPLPCQ